LGASDPTLCDNGFCANAKTFGRADRSLSRSQVAESGFSHIVEGARVAGTSLESIERGIGHDRWRPQPLAGQDDGDDGDGAKTKR